MDDEHHHQTEENQHQVEEEQHQEEESHEQNGKSHQQEEESHQQKEENHQQEGENQTTIDELENELKQHLDKVAELKQLLYKRKKDVFEDKPKVRIEALEPESIKEDLTRPIEECSPTNGSDSLTDRPVVTDFNTTVDTCVMVDYNQKLYEGWLGVEESKRTSHSRGKWMFLWASLDCKQLILKTDPSAGDLDIYKVIDLGRVVCMHHCLPKSFGLDEDRMSQVVQIKYYDDAYYASSSVSNTSIYSENPPNWSGHDFQDVTFRMPKKCNYCMVKLNSIISPPAAYECSKCHLKIHQEHANEPDLSNCSVPLKVKEIKFMAPIQTKWGNWVKKLDGILLLSKEQATCNNKSSCPLLTHDSTLMD